MLKRRCVAEIYPANLEETSSTLPPEPFTPVYGRRCPSVYGEYNQDIDSLCCASKEIIHALMNEVT
jgi:hypothetical protein